MLPRICTSFYFMLTGIYRRTTVYLSIYQLEGSWAVSRLCQLWTKPQWTLKDKFLCEHKFTNMLKLPEQIPQAGKLKQQKCWLMVLEARNPRLSRQQGDFLLRPLPWLEDGHLRHVCTQPFCHVWGLCPDLLFLWGHTSWWIQAHPQDPTLPSYSPKHSNSK